MENGFDSCCMRCLFILMCVSEERLITSSNHGIIDASKKMCFCSSLHLHTVFTGGSLEGKIKSNHKLITSHFLIFIQKQKFSF